MRSLVQRTALACVLLVVLLVATRIGAQESDLIPAGPINAAFKTPMTFVVEDDPAILKYARAIADRFFKDARFLRADDAVKEDLTGTNLMVYGTPEGNAWLRKHAERLPFRFDGAGVRVVEKHTGARLRVICAVRNPEDRSRRAVVYAAARASDIPEINSVFHGPTEWVVADGARTLASGSFPLARVLDPASLQADLDFLVEKIASVHPATVDGLSEELERAVGTARERSERPLDRTDFWFVLNSVIIALHDAHSAMNPASSGEAIDLPVRWLADELIVTADTRELRKGDRIVSLGGRSAAELLEGLKGLVPAENLWWVKHRGEALLQDVAVLRSLGVTSDDTLLTLVERAGRHRRVVLRPGIERRPRQEALPWVRWELHEEYSLGVFTLDRCVIDETYRKTLREFFEAVHAKKIRRVAVDVRQNSGGDSRVVDEFLRYLSVSDYLRYGGDVRVSDDSLAQRGGSGERGYHRGEPRRGTNRQQEHVSPFAGKLYVLTSRRTFSSGNWFAVIAQDNGLGEVIGEPTGNAPSSWGDMLSFDLPESGFSFSLSYKRWIRPDPQRDPAETLTPERLIPVTREHVLAGVDPVLEFLRQDEP